MSSVNQDQLELVIEEVRRHYRNSQTPYYLAEMGVFLRKNDIDVPTGVRVKDYLKSHFVDQLCVIQDSEVPAKIAVATPEVEDSVRQQLADRITEAPLGSTIDFGRLPFSLTYAFCARRTPGSQVYFRTVRPFRYVVSSTAPSNSYVLIDEDFLPSDLEGLLFQNLSAENKRTIHERIEEWARAKDIDLRTIYFDTRSGSFGRESMVSATYSNALQRLVEAQTPELRRKITIPGDIAVALMHLP